MKRVLSGLQATGTLHIGNYLGAMKPWVKWQEEGEAFFFVPNLHSLNIRPKPEDLLKDTYDNVAWLMATGINPDKAVIFAQSQVPAHSELFNILNNFVTMGELARMTQYKDKSVRFGTEGQLVGLYEYPVLMAADILLYDATTVPVGEDQKQHVEIARDIAGRFNNLYGETFVVPEPSLPEYGERVMNLQDPSKKMSKTDPDALGRVDILDDETAIRSKIQKAVTDSGSTIEAGKDKPALTNLLEIYAAFSGDEVEDLVKKYKGKGYGDFKKDLADVIIKELTEVQARYREYSADKAKIESILKSGRAKASEIANKKLAQVKTKLGLL